MKDIRLRKLRTAEAESDAAASEVALGPAIPAGYKMIITAFRPHSQGADTTLNVYAGDAASATRNDVMLNIPCVAAADVGAHDAWMQGDVDNPIFIIEPAHSEVAGVDTYLGNQVYINDGGVRCDVEMEYYFRR